MHKITIVVKTKHHTKQHDENIEPSATTPIIKIGKRSVNKEKPETS